jgi:hypothetical protein
MNAMTLCGVTRAQEVRVMQEAERRVTLDRVIALGWTYPRNRALSTDVLGARWNECGRADHCYAERQGYPGKRERGTRTTLS